MAEGRERLVIGRFKRLPRGTYLAPGVHELLLKPGVLFLHAFRSRRSFASLRYELGQMSLKSTHRQGPRASGGEGEIRRKTGIILLCLRVKKYFLGRQVMTSPIFTKHYLAPREKEGRGGERGGGSLLCEKTCTGRTCFPCLVRP